MITVTGCGLVTAVGFNAPSSLAAIRAGVSGIEEVNLWDVETGEYIAGGRVSLPQWWEGTGKLADLLAPAVLECATAAKPLELCDIPVLVGLSPPDRPCRPDDLETQMMTELAKRMPGPLHPASRPISRGAVSGAAALVEAKRLLEHGHRACIVAGVDSFLDHRVAPHYFESRRLLTPAHSDGFIPGEAASAALVQAGRGALRGLQVLGIGFGHERATIESDEPLRGDGLATAVGAALADAGVTIFDAAYRITDLNGEQYKFKEALFAEMRFEHGGKRAALFDMWHPIEYTGEIGAAIGPCVLAVALHAGEHDYAPGPVALCHFSNDDGERAAVVVRFEAGQAR